MELINKHKQTPPVSLDTLSEHDVQLIEKSVLFDELKRQYIARQQRKQFDRDVLTASWLAQYTSQASRATYAAGLSVFFTWCDMTGKSVLAITSFDADAYVVYLREMYSRESSRRVRIAAVMSFFSYLVRHRVLEYNVFTGIKWPTRVYEPKSAHDIPEAEDLRRIEHCLRQDLQAAGRGSHFKRRQARRMLIVVAVIKHHGLRVGALSAMVIDKHMQYTAYSKGKVIDGVIHSEVQSLFIEFTVNVQTFFKTLKTKTLQKSFERICQRLVALGQLQSVFSLHNIRHFAAVTHYVKYKDIIATQRFLGHASVSTTQIYLRSLRCDC